MEINGSFYRLLKPDVLVKWREDTPCHFAFTAKGHRYATHYLWLKNGAEPVTRTRESMITLGDKLAAVLWQLPARMTKDEQRLRDFAVVLGLWPEVRHVMEFRHRSWFDDQTLAVLIDHGIGVCISDAPTFPRWDVVISNLAYVRLHGHEKAYHSMYGEDGLRPWEARIDTWLAGGNDVHVYFDNDAEGAAPQDARLLQAMVAQRDVAGKLGE